MTLDHIIPLYPQPNQMQSQPQPSKLGVIGATGRMGQEMVAVLAADSRLAQRYVLGPGFSRTLQEKHGVTLEQVFAENRWIVDFSTADMLPKVLRVANDIPRPLVVCSTGWDMAEFKEELVKLGERMPVIVAPNTSIGAVLQRILAREAARAFGGQCDIDISDRHHRHKKDSPSGTAVALRDAVLDELVIGGGIGDADAAGSEDRKRSISGQQRQEDSGAALEKNAPLIPIHSCRSGMVPGEHEINFVTDGEMVKIRHVAFNRSIFAKGAFKAVEWLRRQQEAAEREKQLFAGLYRMEDVFFSREGD